MDICSPSSFPTPDACYAAIQARDTRFDGRFFTGVTSTGVYCRPVCPARLPKRENCTFWPSAAAAEQAGFRACLRCRPEAAPGTPAAQGSAATVSRALRLIGEGALDTGSVCQLADRLGLGERQVRRLFNMHLGANPEAVAATRRLLLANQLLRDTNLAVADIAFASGFSSLRRFNDAFAKRYGEPPTAIRRAARKKGHSATNKDNALPFDLKLRLGFRPPFDWQMILDYFRMRAIPGVEAIDGNRYRRTVRLEESHAFIEAEPDKTRDILWVRVMSDRPFALADLVMRLRRLFDLDAQPQAIGAHFSDDPLIGPLVQQHPGLRIPGAFDGFELAIRAILGQQVSVKGASTIAGRLVEAYGDEVTALGENWPSFLFPEPQTLVRDDLGKLGIPRTRGDTLSTIAKAVADGDVMLHPGVNIPDMVSALTSLKGIGDWTASYVALRALGDPDAFPSGDLGLQKAAAPHSEKLSAKALSATAENWRPWRGYAALHLWSSLSS